MNQCDICHNNVLEVAGYGDHFICVACATYRLEETEKMYDQLQKLIKVGQAENKELQEMLMVANTNWAESKPKKRKK